MECQDSLQLLTSMPEVQCATPPPHVEDTNDCNNHNGWRRKDSLPQARLVACRWLVSCSELSTLKHTLTVCRYGQPHNWKANTAVMSLVIVGLTAVAWSVSAEREVRYKMPEPGRFFPSRKQVSQTEPCVAWD